MGDDVLKELIQSATEIVRAHVERENHLTTDPESQESELLDAAEALLTSWYRAAIQKVREE